ncbi:hypothetical protein ACWGKW_04195 [Streptomyces sp. NPDC054766]
MLVGASSVLAMSVGGFFLTYGVSIFFGLSTLTLGIITLRYKIREHQADIDHIVGADRRATLFLTREPMLKELGEMHKRAESGDVIWGQCVACGNYTDEVRGAILRSAGKGVSFKIIANAYSPSLAEFHALFDPIASAELLEATDNAISVQGLSDKEVVISIREVTAYTGVMIRDPYVVRIVRTWFDERFSAISGGS